MLYRRGRGKDGHAVSPKRMASAWLIGLVFAGCAAVMSDQEQADAARVQITTDREIARGCTFVGIASADNETDLQRKAAWLGGDVAVVTMESQEARASTSWYRSVTYTTEVFRCEGTR
jgi:hypothetical protein